MMHRLPSTNLLNAILNSCERKVRETDDLYWQGKKDGIRIAMILLLEDDLTRMVQITSDSAQYTDEELEVLGIG